MHPYFVLFALLLSVLAGSAQETSYTIDGVQVKGQTSDQKEKKFESVSIVQYVSKDTFTYFSIIDSNYTRYALPTEFVKPEKWKKADEGRKKIERYGNQIPDSFNLQTVLSIIDSEKDFPTFLSAKSWCLKNYQEAFPALVARLTQKTKIGIENSADLIISDRMWTGDLKFYGHGGGMQEDIFTIAGRASWILNELTGENFATVRIGLTQEEALEYQKMWSEYLIKLNNK